MQQREPLFELFLGSVRLTPHGTRLALAAARLATGKGPRELDRLTLAHSGNRDFLCLLHSDPAYRPTLRKDVHPSAPVVAAAWNAANAALGLDRPAYQPEA